MCVIIAVRSELLSNTVVLFVYHFENYRSDRELEVRILSETRVLERPIDIGFVPFLQTISRTIIEASCIVLIMLCAVVVYEEFWLQDGDEVFDRRI